MTQVLRGNDLRELCARIAPRAATNRPEVQEHHRVRAHLAQIVLVGTRDLESFEKGGTARYRPRAVLDRRLEIALQHAHGKRLAKASRPAEERDVVRRVNELPNERRLIDVDALRDDGLEVLASDRQPAIPRPVDDRAHGTLQSRRRARPPTAPHTTRLGTQAHRLEPSDEPCPNRQHVSCHCTRTMGVFRVTASVARALCIR